jgi:hypothetical protein
MLYSTTSQFQVHALELAQFAVSLLEIHYFIITLLAWFHLESLNGHIKLLCDCTILGRKSPRVF